MAVDHDPDLWFDQNGGAVKTAITEGVAATGSLTVYSGDGTNGIDGLNLTAAEATTDKSSFARIMKAIMEFQYSYQEVLATADKPTSCIITRSASTSGTTMYTTYSYRYTINTESMEVNDSDDT